MRAKMRCRDPTFGAKTTSGKQLLSAGWGSPVIRPKYKTLKIKENQGVKGVFSFGQMAIWSNGKV